MYVYARERERERESEKERDRKRQIKPTRLASQSENRYRKAGLLASVSKVIQFPIDGLRFL